LALVAQAVVELVEYLVQIMLLLVLQILVVAAVAVAVGHHLHRLKQELLAAQVLLFLDYIRKVNDE
jgi:hypothetical protein